MKGKLILAIGIVGLPFWLVDRHRTRVLNEQQRWEIDTEWRSSTSWPNIAKAAVHTSWEETRTHFAENLGRSVESYRPYRHTIIRDLRCYLYHASRGISGYSIHRALTTIQDMPLPLEERVAIWESVMDACDGDLVHYRAYQMGQVIEWDKGANDPLWWLVEYHHFFNTQTMLRAMHRACYGHDRLAPTANSLAWDLLRRRDGNFTEPQRILLGIIAKRVGVDDLAYEPLDEVRL